MQAVAPYGRPAIGLAAAGRAREQLPPLASVVGLPIGLDLAATSRPLARGLGRGLVVGGKPWLAAPPPHWLRAGPCRKLITRSLKLIFHTKILALIPLEIVYLCISDPDGEDEGGQASSSLAVSTCWISAAKLLQSDLQLLRKGREENRRWWLKL
ncbi:hypothetical protein BHM03_00031239 [Ensete ventricosum]|nr:hypothetical protein BHM03_00031239 [Ensete ventricosum]